MKKVAFYTLGCKVNQSETEAMLEMFKKDGYLGTISLCLPYLNLFLKIKCMESN